MIQHVFPLLPQSLTSTHVGLCIVALAAGVVLWIIGGVWSRAIVTLIAVAIGGTLGLWLPRWYIWPVNSMSIAVLGAVALGVIAFAVPRLWVGIVLGFVFTAWALLGTVILLRGDAEFMPRADWETQHMIFPDYAKDVFDRLPDPVRRVVPYSAAMAMISGLAISLLWPRFGRTLMGSTLGVTVIFVSALTLVANRKPEWLYYVPTQPGAQVAILVGLSLLGALIQWQILPTRREAKVLDEPEQQQSSVPDIR